MMLKSFRCVAAVSAFLLSSNAIFAFPEWTSGRQWEEPKVVTPGDTAASPPADAIILFDGKDMSAWEGGDTWELHDGYGVVKKSVNTKQKFGDCQLHLEFASPSEVKGNGQGRGNSGCYFMGRYEVQILDSFENQTYFDGQCASIYKQFPPLVNACRKPGEWQIYDIIFTAPRFNEDKSLKSPAYLTVIQNGVVVQNHSELLGGTFYDAPPHYNAHGLRDSISLQYHNNPVKFRNIWVRDLMPKDKTEAEQAAELTAKTAVKEGEAKPIMTYQLGQGDLLKGIPGSGPLTVDQIKNWLSHPNNHVELELELPLGLAAGKSEIKGVKENPMTFAKIELGRQLYFDTRLSSNNKISCASCHHPDEGFGKHTQFGIGVDDQQGNRNSPISYNRILSGLQFWDGRAESLEEQAVGPIANPIEMGNTHDAAVKSIAEIPGYKVQFDAIFGEDSVNIDNVGKAIAAFERAIVTGPAPYDYNEELKRFSKLDPEDLQDLLEDNKDFANQYKAAQQGAQEHPMTESALRGQELFFSERVSCAACHVGANLADEKYHNLGIGMDAKEPDLGRFVVTGDEKDWGAFKTPTVRNVEFSAPYMHDGSLKTLEEVVEHYNKGGTPNKNLSDKIKKLNLTEQESKDLVEFMKACTGPFPNIASNRLPQ